MEGARKGYARQMARKVIKDCGICELPINLKKILEKKDYKYIEVDTFLDNVDALFIRDEDEGVIYAAVNANHHIHRQRFSLAHEFGHILLNHDLDDYRADISMDNPPTAKSHTAYEKVYETEANNFAGELLVPLEFLKQEVKNTNDLKELSRIFLVSQHVLSIAMSTHINSLFK